MLRLYILRHAKSSWGEPGISDFERGLNPRGLKDVAKIARHMKRHSYVPHHVCASSATRTRLTIDGIKQAAAFDFSVEYADDLYSGSVDNYLSLLQSCGDSSQSLMLVGHNPTCESLAAQLIGKGEAHALAQIAQKYPSGAMAVIDIAAKNWADIGGKTGDLRDFVIPRQL